MKENLIYKEKKREITFTLNETNFTMIGIKENYERDYKIEDINKLIKKDNCVSIKLDKFKKKYTLISEKTDWYSNILSKILNLNKIIKTDYLINENKKQNKNVFSLLNEKYFQCYIINHNNDCDKNIEKIININLNDIIDIYSTNLSNKNTCFTIELKKEKYNFYGKTIEEKENWIKEIGIATIKNKYPQYFNNNNNCISEFVELVPDN